MRKILFGLLFITKILNGQSDHDLNFGLNYPYNFTYGNFVKDFGIVFGYNYSKFIVKNLYLRTGGEFYFHHHIDINEKLPTLDFNIPLLIGYTHNKISYNAGLVFFVGRFASSHGVDPEIGYISENRKYPEPYINYGWTRRMKLGINAGVDYKLSNLFYASFNSQFIIFKEEYYGNRKYYYGLSSLGIKLRLK